MTTNIFGSGVKASSSDNKKYINSKFIAFMQNLQLKLEKSGDTMHGILNMGGNKISNIGMPVSRLDAVTKEYVDLDVVALNENLQLKLDKTGGTILGDINMDGNKIKNVGQPIHNLDVVSKKYVDDKFEQMLNLYTLSTTGLVPHPIEASGFVVNTSSELNAEYRGQKVFNALNRNQWKVADSNRRNFWIEVSCPFEVRIYRFLIQPAENTKLLKWRIEGCMDEFHRYDALPFTTEPLTSTTTKAFTMENPKLARGYWRYRIFVEEAEGENPGLTYWQLYAINPVFS